MNGPVQEQPQPKPQENATDAASFVKPAITAETEQVIKAHDAQQTEELHNELGQIPLNPAKVEALNAQQTSDSMIPEAPQRKEKFEDTKRLLHVVEEDKRNLIMKNLPKEKIETEDLQHAA